MPICLVIMDLFYCCGLRRSFAIKKSVTTIGMLHSAPQSLKTPRRLENFTKYHGLPDMSYCQQLHLENRSSQMHPRLEKIKQSWRGRERWGRKTRMNANKSEYSFPRLLRLDQFSCDWGLWREVNMLDGVCGWSLVVWESVGVWIQSGRSLSSSEPS